MTRELEVLLFNDCRYERLQGGGVDSSVEEKQKKGLFQKVKDAVKSPGKDDSVCYVPFSRTAFWQYVYVIAWFGVKFGINHTSNVPRMGLNYTRQSRVQFTILGTLRV